MPSYSWPVNPGVVAAMTGGRLRVSFPVELLDTPSLRSPSNYVITQPLNSPAVRAFEVKVLNTYTIELGLSGKMLSGAYSLGITAVTARELADGVPNPAYSIAFAGVVGPYHAPLSSALLAVKSLMGSGLSFPLRVGSDGEFVRVTAEDNVDECLVQLIRTEQGERPFVTRNGRMFGTQLRAILFENGEDAQPLAFQTVNEAILIWESRVRLLELEVLEEINEGGGSTILVAIKYLVTATSNIRNLVFPFTLNRNR